MYVIVQLRTAIAEDFAQAQPQFADTQRLRDSLSDLKVVLQPLHPGTDDRELAQQFFVIVPDEQSATKVAERMRQSGAVEAAYVKPPDAAPFHQA